MWIIIGKIFMIIGVLLMGPELTIGYSFYLENETITSLMTTGLCVLGFSTSFNIIPLFPLLMSVIKRHYNVAGCDVTDLASGLYTAAFGVGTIFGPLIGAYLDQKFGF